MTKYLCFALCLLLCGTVRGAEGEVAAAMHPKLAEMTKSLVDSEGKRVKQEQLLKHEYVLIYFSAHWCPPCRAFTPDLVKFYNETGGGDKYSLLFVSSDRSEKDMLGYMKEAKMPWSALNFTSPKVAAMKKTYGGPGIPCLVVLNKDDEVLYHSYVDKAYVGPRAVMDQFQALLKKQ